MFSFAADITIPGVFMSFLSLDFDLSAAEVIRVRFGGTLSFLCGILRVVYIDPVEDLGSKVCPHSVYIFMFILP